MFGLERVLLDPLGRYSEIKVTKKCKPSAVSKTDYEGR
jgi:hypothetical protein